MFPLSPPAPFPGHRGTNPGYGRDGPSPAVSAAPGWVSRRREAGKQLSDLAPGEALFAGDVSVQRAGAVVGMATPRG